MDEIIDKPDKSLQNEGDKLKSWQELKAMRKTARIYTQERLAAGDDRNSIFNELIEKFGTRNEKLLAQDVAYEFLPEHLSGKKIFFYMLLALQTAELAVVLFLYQSQIAEQGFDGLGIAFYIFGTLYVLFLAWILKSLYQFKGAVLSSVIILSILRVVGEGFSLVNGTTDEYGYLQLAIGIPSLALAYFLRKKLLPHLGFFGPRKDKSGQYTF